MAQQVSSARTPFSPIEGYSELRAAWRRQMPSTPERPTLLILLSQIMLETAWGQRAVCWNPGNFKHTNADGHDWCSFVTAEVVGGVARTLTQQFRAYATLSDGMSDYLHGVRNWYPGAWTAALDNDIQGYAHALALRGYYTAPEKQYAAGLVGTRARLDAMIGPDTEPDLQTLSSASDLAAIDEATAQEVLDVAEEKEGG